MKGLFQDNLAKGRPSCRGVNIQFMGRGNVLSVICVGRGREKDGYINSVYHGETI